MFKLFGLIFIRNIRSVMTLFLVILLSSTGFLVMRELTTNIENLVAKETQPIFGADIRISPKSYITAPIIETLIQYLSGFVYSYAERTEFSTTLIDREGKIGLVKVIAYSGTYPQKGILKMEPFSGATFSGGYRAASSELIDRFSTGGAIILDGQRIVVSHRIIESSDFGFSFGQENNLIILPKSDLSGSMLISSGSRLDHDLLLSFSDESDIDGVAKILKNSPKLSNFQVRTYSERSEQTFDITKELTNYILLILVVAALFAGIILRSAHESLFANLSNTLRIFEILGFTRSRQITIFTLLYGSIIPIAFILAILLSYTIILAIHTIPAAKEFSFFFAPIIFTLQIISLLIFTAFAPVWIERLGLRLPITPKIPENIRTALLKYVPFSGIILFLGIWGIIYIIFERLVWSSLITFSGLFVFLVIGVLLSYLYRYIYNQSGGLRRWYFSIFDGVRALIRPMTPSIPITISLISITSFFVLFSLFSLGFRERLLVDTRDSANIYAINILDSDLPRLESVLSGAEIYSIIRSRISRINGRTLEDHLDNKNPTGEFTREFNITTNTLTFPILRGHSELSADEVSVDDEFSRQLHVDIGDTIEFALSGKKFTLRVANIRQSVREGFRPFFYFSFQAEAFRTAPKTYFVSAYSTDIESWKKMILENTGPHVTFVDIENILQIARDISLRILSVIFLFFISVSIFGILAIFSLFSRLSAIESAKQRLYSLFGSSPQSTRVSFLTTRYVILGISYILSISIGVGLWTYVLRTITLLEFQFSSLVLTAIAMLIVYIFLAFAIRPRVDTTR